MNNAVKSALLVLGGALLGGAGTYFVCKKKFYEVFNARLDAEVEAYKEQTEMVTEAYTKLLHDVSVNADKVEAPKEKSEEPSNSKVAKPVDYSAIAPKTDKVYSFQEVPDEETKKEPVEEQSEESKAEDDEYNEIDEAVERPIKIPRDRDKEAYIIDEDTFDNMGANGYDREVLVLYSDGALAEESTDDLVDSHELLGKCLASMPRTNGAEMFVANEWLGVVYQIIYENKTYEEVTGGRYM